ncbi:hypothetical protein OG625_09120 [Streptomyces sp. NBC_01351]|uniref:hypothetical protein n=1 Tax=Streptomyces sp. NBC_01351 TaxID=2903833 RepID=UPI002E3095FD|nr:hypothetical protein [Streptomyces sp. NBC_01351]
MPTPPPPSPGPSGCTIGCGLMIAAFVFFIVMSTITGGSSSVDTNDCRSWSGIGDGTVDWQAECESVYP